MATIARKLLLDPLMEVRIGNGCWMECEGVLKEEPCAAASNLGDAWADTVASLSGKTLFVLRNSLDAPLLARVFELCLARGRDSTST